MILDTRAKLHEMTFVVTGRTLVTALKMDDIITHFKGGLPTSYSVRTVYNDAPISYDDAMRFADQPYFDDIEAHINLI